MSNSNNFAVKMNFPPFSFVVESYDLLTFLIYTEVNLLIYTELFIHHPDISRLFLENSVDNATSVPQSIIKTVNLFYLTNSDSSL